MIVGVIGSGSIGPDLAYGFLSALAHTRGARVYLVDIKQEALDAGVARIRGYLDKGIARGKISATAAEAMNKALVPTLAIEDLGNCEYVLEAASEDLPIKRAILAKLEAIVEDTCLIGFATSGLPRAEIAAEAAHPERCFVNHPFFPAWRSLPIEVVSPDARPELEARMLATLRTLGKVPIPTADVPCFAADDIFCNYISEAARIVEDGVATPAQVDAIVNDAIGGGGPFLVMDATRGNLLTVHCQELMQAAETGSEWFRPPAILAARGNSPWHTEPASSAYDEELGRKVLDRILAVLLARTYFVIDNGICDATELDWMTRTALGFRPGLVQVAAELGAERVFELCSQYAARNPGFHVPPSIAERQLPAIRANVKVERHGDVGTLRVFRPEVKNALSSQTIAELDSGLAELAADSNISAIILTSYDGSLAGADIGELAALHSPQECRDICHRSHPIFARFADCAKPVIAALDGPVLGGGAELSMACRARVLGPNTVVGQPEVNLGIIPGYGGTMRLPRLIGVHAATEMIRTARTMSAEEAAKRGWGTLAGDTDVEAAAVALAHRHLDGTAKLPAMSPEPIAMPDTFPGVDIGHRSLAIDAIVVDVMRRGLALPLDKGLEVEAEGFARCKDTVDMDIGMKNFQQNGPRTPAVFLHE